MARKKKLTYEQQLAEIEIQMSELQQKHKDIQAQHIAEQDKQKIIDFVKGKEITAEQVMMLYEVIHDPEIYKQAKKVIADHKKAASEATKRSKAKAEAEFKKKIEEVDSKYK